MIRRPALLTVAVAAVVASTAHAAPYDLELQGCIQSDEAGASCATTDPELRSRDLAVSPDGRNVYVAGYRRPDGTRHAVDGRLAVYNRADDGSLRLASCFIDGGGAGCADAPIPALLGANGVAVSPDGRSVYVTGSGDESAAHPGAVLAFARGPDGGLVFESCIGSGSADGCAGGKAATGIGFPDEIAVSPAGDHVVVGGFTGTLVDFRRDAGGRLDWGGCLSGSEPLCRPAPPIRYLFGLAFSADGRDLYAAGYSAFENGTVAHLVRDEKGELVVTDCVGTPGGPCGTTSTHLRGADGVTVTPDDGEVFVTAITSAAVTRFLRGPGGGLSEFGCANSDGADGCSNARMNLFGMQGIAASPDGSGVYAAIDTGRLITFARRRDAGLAPIRCQSPVRSACDFNGFNGSAPAVFSPDGANLYTLSVFGRYQTLAIYRRAGAGGTTIAPGGLPVLPPHLGGIGMLRGRLGFTLDKAARVTVTLDRVLAGRIVRGRCVARTRTNARRRACTRLKKAGSLAVSGKPGSNDFALPKGLARGGYRATLMAVAGGKASQPRTKSFTVR